MPKPILTPALRILSRPDNACLYAYSAFSRLTAEKPSSLPVSTSAKMTTIVGTMYAPRSATNFAVSSSISVPCSIERTPNSTQRRIALAGWQCAAT